MNYYKICVKLGHLGTKKYLETWVYVKAENSYSAIKKAQSRSGVKHGKLPTQVVKIEREEYTQGIKEDKYYNDLKNIFEK